MCINYPGRCNLRAGRDHAVVRVSKSPNAVWDPAVRRERPVALVCDLGARDSAAGGGKLGMPKSGTLVVMGLKGFMGCPLS